VYVVFGGVKWDYAWLMIVTSIVVTAVGQVLMNDIINRMGRRSIIIIGMATLITAGAAIMGLQTFVRVKNAYPNKFLHHGKICGED
jgi:MFS family permease